MAKYKFFQAGEKELDQLYELGKQFRQEFRKIFPQVDEDKAYKIPFEADWPTVNLSP